MYPDDCRYTEEHEWVRLGDDVAVVGITHHAQESLGDVVFVELPEPGTTVTQSEECGVIDSVKASSALYSPVTGIVQEANSALESQPELVNQEPYGAGWIMKVAPKDLSEVEGLLSAADYQEFLTTLEQ